MPRKGAFKRCVESVAERGGAVDPAAVCAAAGRAKYGKRAFAAMGRAGKRRAARKKGNPRQYTYKITERDEWFYVDVLRDGGVVRADLGPYYPRANAVAAAQREIEHRKQQDREDEGFAKRWRGNAAKLRQNPVRKNHHNEPAAIEAYKDFHGREPEELIEFETRTHFPGRTAAIGELISLKIKIPSGRVSDGSRVVTVKNFDGAMLTRHPSKIQLYVEGGDQSLDLDEFGLSNADAHEVEYLGHLVEVTYYTVKDHLGSEGGEANYVHKFGMNESTGEKTEFPRVNYRVADEQIELSGGGYTIPSEGIDG